MSNIKTQRKKGHCINIWGLEYTYNGYGTMVEIYHWFNEMLRLETGRSRLTPEEKEVVKKAVCNFYGFDPNRTVDYYADEKGLNFIYETTLQPYIRQHENEILSKGIMCM